MTKEQIIKEFREKYVEKMSPTGAGAVQCCSEDIEPFILSVYDSAIDECQKVVEGKKIPSEANDLIEAQNMMCTMIALDLKSLKESK